MTPSAEFVHEPQDLLALNGVLAARSRLVRLSSLLGPLLIAAAFGIAAGLTDWPSGAGWPVPVAAAAGFAVGWVVQWAVGWPAARGAARLQARAMWSAARREGLLVPQRVEITPVGLRSVSENGETLSRWSTVREVVRTEDHVFVFISPRTAFMAPRRAFSSTEAFECFAREAKERWRDAGEA